MIVKRIGFDQNREMIRVFQKWHVGPGIQGLCVTRAEAQHCLHPFFIMVILSKKARQIYNFLTNFINFIKIKIVVEIYYFN